MAMSPRDPLGWQSSEPEKWAPTTSAGSGT